MANEPSIENLGQIDEWESYEPPSDKVRPPEPKEYTFMRSTDEGTLKSGTFTLQNGDSAGLEVAWFNFRALIQGGPNDGRIAFGGCNTMPSKFRKGTTVQDFIFAAKSSLRPSSTQLLAEIKAEKPSSIERVVGPFNARTNWEWRCSECEETFLKGFKNPKSPKKYTGPKATVAKNADGSTNHAQKCPGCSAEVGATLIITDFVVPKNGAATMPRTDGPRVPANLPPIAG